MASFELSRLLGPAGRLSYSIIAWPLVLALIYRLIIYPRFMSPLARVPNAHWSSPFSSIWILLIRFQSRENRVVHAAHVKYGSVVRLGPNEVSVNCVDGGIRTIYSGGFEKGDWYSLFDNYGVQCMFSSLHSRSHSIRKRMISHTYSKSTIQTSPAFASQAVTIIFSRLLPIIDASSQPSQPPYGIDVHDLWNATAMDFITAYIFGLRHSYNFLKDVGYRQHWLELYQSRKTYTFFPQEMPLLTKLLRTFGIRLVPRWVDWANEELEAGCAAMCKAATITARSQKSYSSSPGDEPVVLNALLSGIEKEQRMKGSESILLNSTLTKPDLSIASEMLDEFCAGHETTGITMTYLTWHLSQNLALQKLLRTELRTLNHPLTYPTPPSTSLEDIRLPASKQLDGLPILHAVIMETLRLKAAIPGSQPRLSPSPSPSCILGGFEIPPGTRVSAAAWSLHRNETVYPNPEVWDHTRWLNGVGHGEVPDSEARRERDRWFWAFSSGGRMCIGSNFAMHEMKLITAAIYTNFTTHVVDDDGIEQMDGYTCGPKGNRLFLKFEKAED